MTATAETKVDWHLVGNLVNTCNCDWACPCQFNDIKPTHDSCEAIGTWTIREGQYGDTDLSGAKFAVAWKWPGPVHLGGGTRMLMLDDGTSESQREALIAIESGKQGHPFFEIFSTVAPTALSPAVAAISMDFDVEERTAHIVIEGLAENTVGPIVGFSNEPSRIRLDLPSGFEFKQAEVASSSGWHLDGPAPMTMRHERTYTHLCSVDWSSDGTTR